MMQIRRLAADEPVPMDLLLLADPSETLIRNYVTKGQCYIAETVMSFEVIGVYVLLPTKPATIEIVNIAVAEKLQNNGIGRELLYHAISNAQSQGYETIEIGTGNSSIGQLALYQKCGFRITAIDKDFFIRNYPEEIYENGIQCRDMIRLSLNLQC